MENTCDLDFAPEHVTENASTSDGVINVLSVVAFCGLIVATFFMGFVAPKFIDIFKSLRVELPVPTKLVLAIAQHPPLLLAFLGGGILLIELIRRRQSRKLAIVFMILALATGPLAYASVLLPILKIQDTLLKK